MSGAGRPEPDDDEQGLTTIREEAHVVREGFPPGRPRTPCSPSDGGLAVFHRWALRVHLARTNDVEPGHLAAGFA